jgi:hypothetical protein
MPLVIKVLAIIHVGRITSLGQTGIVLDSPKDSLDGLFETLLLGAPDAPLSSTIPLVVIAQVVTWRPAVLYCKCL